MRHAQSGAWHLAVLLDDPPQDARWNQQDARIRLAKGGVKLCDRQSPNTSGFHSGLQKFAADRVSQARNA